MEDILRAVKSHDSPWFLYANDVPINPGTLRSTLRALRGKRAAA
jgi:hypothetical protein